MGRRRLFRRAGLVIERSHSSDARHRNIEQPTHSGTRESRAVRRLRCSLILPAYHYGPRSNIRALALLDFHHRLDGVAAIATSTVDVGDA